jgi:hypothetical protein
VSLETNTRIETYTGRLYDFANPQPDQVCVEDIAHALSQVCRYGGHIEHAYSVGQHALLVRRLVCSHFGRPDLGYAALHHDSAEAYTGDVMKPMKVAMEKMGFLARDAFSKIEEAAEVAVGVHLGVDSALFRDPVIKDADSMALRMEAAVLKVNDGRSFAEASGVEPLTPIDGVADLRLPPEVEADFHAAHQEELQTQREEDNE